MFDLTGKVALITGGNGGIGLGMARGLAKAGASIAIAARNQEKSAQAADELRAAVDARCSGAGVEPEEFWSLAPLGYDVFVTWSASGGGDTYDVFFRRQGVGNGEHEYIPRASIKRSDRVDRPVEQRDPRPHWILIRRIRPVSQ